MSSLAAAGDTWGIPGPRFLTIYVTLAAMLVLGSLAHRIWLLAVPRSRGTDRLDPEQVAYLNGGDRLAIHMALGALRGVGTIGVVADRLLIRTGPMPAGATALQQSLYHALSRRVRIRDLFRDAWVAAALADLRRWLEDQGLLLPVAHRRAAKFTATSLLVLIGVGGLRVFAGVRDDKPVGYLAVGLVVLVACHLVLGRVPLRTRAGNAALKRLRAQYPHLSPKRSPAYATYGAAGVAMGVALYGTGSLWVADPAFASSAGISGASSDGGNYSGGGDSGSSCGGGGGCGSSCGGGGCGGGGCGG